MTTKKHKSEGPPCGCGCVRLCPRTCPEIQKIDEANQVASEEAIRAMHEIFSPEPPGDIVVPEACQDDGGIYGDIDTKCRTACKLERG